MVAIQTEVVNTSLGTLAGNTALQIGNNHETALKRSFLIKKVRIQMTWDAATAGEGPVAVGLAVGQSSVATIKSAIEDTLLYDDQSVTASKKGVLHETLTQIYTTNPTVDTGWISVGGGKGIPVSEDYGYEIFAYNVSSGVLTTGSAARGIVHVMGVWL